MSESIELSEGFLLVSTSSLVHGAKLVSGFEENGPPCDTKSGAPNCGRKFRKPSRSQQTKRRSGIREPNKTKSSEIWRGLQFGLFENQKKQWRGLQFGLCPFSYTMKPVCWSNRHAYVESPNTSREVSAPMGLSPNVRWRVLALAKIRVLAHEIRERGSCPEVGFFVNNMQRE